MSATFFLRSLGVRNRCWGFS